MIQVNAMGDNCPIPVIKTKKAIEALTGPEVVEVLVDNEVAVQNVTKMAQTLGGSVTSERIAEKEFKIRIQIGDVLSAEEEEVVCIPDRRENTIIVISSDRMGTGNDELGKVLIKGFIFAVTQLDTLPKTMLFYNGGATLTVEILTCGTCLNYYGLTEKLGVGSVTNMYSIVEKMAEAGKIVQP